VEILIITEIQAVSNIMKSDQHTRWKNLLRCHWHNILVLNVHALTRNRRYDTKDSFYQESEHVFNQFPKYHMEMLGEKVLSNNNQE
jgi:hypothetical protein